MKYQLIQLFILLILHLPSSSIHSQPTNTTKVAGMPAYGIPDFWVTTDTNDVANAQWYADATTLTGMTSRTNGLGNTNNYSFPSGTAADVCKKKSVGSAGGQWYLPSQIELYMIYAAFRAGSLSGFGTSAYHWSSTEYDKGWAWYVGFNFGGLDYTLTKTGTTPVRCAWRDVCNGVTSITDTRDGQVSTYTVKAIGNACWMTQNLRYYPESTVYINPGTMNSTTPVTITSAASIHDNTSMKYFEKDTVIVTRDQFTQKFGVLYNWNQAMNGASSTTTSNSVQGICPAGWYMPTDNDYAALVTYLGTNPGTRVKADSSTYGWNNKVTSAWNGSNTSGFKAYPSGYYLYESGILAGFGDNTDYWTATQNASVTGNGTSRDLNGGSSTNFDAGSGDKRRGYSIRCKK